MLLQSNQKKQQASPILLLVILLLLSEISIWQIFTNEQLFTSVSSFLAEKIPQKEQTKKPPGMLSHSKIASLGKDTITLEVSVDD